MILYFGMSAVILTACTFDYHAMVTYSAWEGHLALRLWDIHL